MARLSICTYVQRENRSHKGAQALITDTNAPQIKDAVGNDYGRPKDVVGETRMAFTSLADTAFDVCFENTLTGRRTFKFTDPPRACVDEIQNHPTTNTSAMSSWTSILAPTREIGLPSRLRRS
jgi:hypothetical protein